MRRVLQYLKQAIVNKMIMGTDSLRQLCTWADHAYGVHPIRHVLLNLYIDGSVSSSAAEIHLGRTEPVPSHLRHLLAQHD